MVWKATPDLAALQIRNLVLWSSGKMKHLLFEGCSFDPAQSSFSSAFLFYPISVNASKETSRVLNLNYYKLYLNWLVEFVFKLKWTELNLNWNWTELNLIKLFVWNAIARQDYKANHIMITPLSYFLIQWYQKRLRLIYKSYHKISFPKFGSKG